MTSGFFLALAITVGIIAANEQCRDLHQTIQCREWAWFGECDNNKEYMDVQCRQSCGLCDSATTRPSDSSGVTVAPSETAQCKDAFHSCDEWADHDKCHGLWTSKKGSYEINAAYIVEFCPKACNVCDIHLDERDISLNLGLPQEAPGMDTDIHLKHHIRAKVQEIRKYVQSFKDKTLREACKMSHPNCARFSLATDCEDHANHEIIKYGCAAACKTCENLVHDNGIAMAEAFWSKALKEYESKHQTTYTMAAYS